MSTYHKFLTWLTEQGPETTGELAKKAQVTVAYAGKCLLALKQQGLIDRVLIKTNTHRNGTWLWYHKDELAFNVQEAVQQIKSIESKKTSFTEQTSK